MVFNVQRGALSLCPHGSSRPLFPSSPCGLRKEMLSPGLIINVNLIPIWGSDLLHLDVPRSVARVWQLPLHVRVRFLRTLLTMHVISFDPNKI